MKLSQIPTAPLAERIDCYRYFSALHFFERARGILLQIQQEGDLCEDSEESELTRLPANAVTLCHAFYVLYAKPFKQQQDKELKLGLRILADDVVPAAFRKTHDDTIKLRDKMY